MRRLWWHLRLLVKMQSLTVWAVTLGLAWAMHGLSEEKATRVCATAGYLLGLMAYAKTHGPTDAEIEKSTKGLWEERERAEREGTW